MIRIKLKSSNATVFEDEYWKWFKTYQLKKFIPIIRNSSILKKYLFDNFAQWEERNIKENIKIRDIDDNELKSIKDIVVCKPENLREKKEELMSKCFLKKDDDDYNYFIETYSKIRGSKQIIELYLKYLDLKTCPYCNRSFISKANRKNKNIYLTYEFDHFFSKEDNPVLAISLYNLIPSCHTCNHLKLDKKLDIIYPYLEEFGGGGVFKFKNTSILKQQLCKDSKIDYELSTTDIKILNSIETFELQELYKSHESEAIDLIHKKRIFTNQYINEQIENYLETFGYTAEQIHALVFSHYTSEDMHRNKIISKFLNDLYVDLVRKGI